MTALDEAAAAIASAGTVALACHAFPDGDALGSMLGLHHLCRSQGRSSVAAWPEPDQVAPHYRFLPGLDTVTRAAEFPARPDVMVTFDCGSPDRLGRLEPAARAAGQLIVLDHHATAVPFGTINVIDPAAAATAVVVRRLAERLGWPLNREAAECLYVGLVTDTGSFRHDNTTAEVFLLAAELASFGLPIARDSRQLFSKHRFAYLGLAAECLAGARLDADLGLVTAVVRRADLERFGVGMDETEGLIDLVRTTAEAEVAAVAKEFPDRVKVSLRSVERVDVGRIAAGLGGGGHRFAGGFDYRGTAEAALEAVAAALRGEAAESMRGEAAESMRGEAAEAEPKR
ncbi:MAG TPA: DHH family phosphoesterase [Acidimicrobiales bacterium]|nr:DHH family phosphoesterase [Acidimicrobiales bacterium]